MSDPADTKTTRPMSSLSDEGLALHVASAIRERADVAYRMTEDGPELRQGGEYSIWKAVQEAVAEAGWEVRRRA